MIQPAEPEGAARGPAGQPARASTREPAVYGTGCAGRITSFAETEDGRFLITLTGVCRFRIVREIPTARGYRRIVPDWAAFAGDLAEPAGARIDRQRLLEGLRPYFRQHGLGVRWDTVESAADEWLVNSLAMICPFSPSEKQALLEAPTLEERARLMTAMIEMAVLDRGDGAARH
jgi:Lon protease-like protein